MSVSQKCQYALRSVFELSDGYGRGPLSVSSIAKVQAIPLRFLELILGELRQGGYVESRRGSRGGYILTRSPSQLNVGEIISFVDGPIGPVGCVSTGDTAGCPLYGDCVFMGMWTRARDAVANVYEKTTFQSLVDEDRIRRVKYVPDYAI